MPNEVTLILFIVVGIPLFIILFAIIYFCIKDHLETEVKNRAIISLAETDKSVISKEKVEVNNKRDFTEKEFQTLRKIVTYCESPYINHQPYIHYLAWKSISERIDGLQKAVDYGYDYINEKYFYRSLDKQTTTKLFRAVYDIYKDVLNLPNRDWESEDKEELKKQRDFKNLVSSKIEKICK